VRFRPRITPRPLDEERSWFGRRARATAGAAETFDIVTSAPTAPDLWQVHRSLDTDAAHNTEDDLIANQGEAEADEAHWVRAVVDATGLVELTNGRNGHARTYQAR